MPFGVSNDLLAEQPLFPGQIAYANSLDEVRTFYNAEASTVIPFGAGVVYGTVADGERTFLPAEMPDNGSDVFAGVAIKTETIEKRAGTAGTDALVSLDADGYHGYPVDMQMGVMTKGVIGVRVANVVTPTSTVYLVHTANGASKPGMFRSDADTSNALQVSNCKFLEAGTAGSIVRLAVNLV